MRLVRWDVSRLPLADNSVDMIFSDPPYVAAEIETYRSLALEAARVLRPGKFVAVMCGGNALNRIMRWFDDSGLQFWWLYQVGMRGQGASTIWKGGNNKTPIIARTKHVLVYCKGNGLPRTATVGLYWAGGADKRWHHWGQDVDSHRYYIDCFSKCGDMVIDPMCGGGTTAVACTVLGRQWAMGDLDIDALLTSRGRLAGPPPIGDLPLFISVPEAAA